MVRRARVEAASPILLSISVSSESLSLTAEPMYITHRQHLSRVAQGAYLEVEYIRNVLSVSGTLKYADSGTA